MVKITYIGKRSSRRLRNRKGNVFNWCRGDTRDIEDESLLEKLKGSKNFIRQDEIGKKGGGGGIKTHIRPPKRIGRPPKSRKHLGKSKQAAKEEVKVPKSVMDKINRDINKKPKGLKKKKGIGIDLDGDGKVDVVVGDD